MGVRTRPHRRGVPRQAHDGHLGAGAVQGRPGEVDLDFDNPTGASFEAEIDATRLWTGEPERDAHLRSADFFDVEHHPRITFRSTRVEQVGSVLYKVTGVSTIRGVTRPVTWDVHYLEQ